MKEVCYIFEMNSSLDGLFEQLDDYGFDYACDRDWPRANYIEICVWYYPQEIRDLENILAPYV